MPNGQFQCGVHGCLNIFSKATSFKTHYYRCHRNLKLTKQKAINNQISLMCGVDTCSEVFLGLRQLTSHLTDHINEGIAVPCPFSNCDKFFNFRSTLSSHISRKHKGETLPGRPELLTEQCNESDSFAPEDSDDSQAENDCADYLPVSKEDIETCLGQFYLKLQAKNVLPATLIQDILEGLQSVNDLCQQQQQHFFQEILSKHLDEEEVKQCMDQMKELDHVKTCNYVTF